MEKIQLEFFVIGDAGSGKKYFIEKFLKFYELASFICREKDNLYTCHISNENVTIWLHDVKDISILKKTDLEVHGIFFCYSSCYRKSFENLAEHWITPLVSKAQLCFLVANETDLNAERKGLGQQQQVSEKEVRQLVELFKLWRINEYEEIENIVEKFTHMSFHRQLSNGRQSRADLSYQQKSAQTQSRPEVSRQYRAKGSYIKPGKTRPIH